MGKIFFTADTHWGHENVIGFDKRPFKTVEEMDAELIRRWNAKVGKGDLVYVLGDMIWKTRNDTAEALIRSLNGQIILIKGNHDRFLHNAKAKNALDGVKDYDDICVKLEDGSERRVILSHYYMPFYNGHRYQGIHLHGHSHNTEECMQEELIKRSLAANGFETRAYNVGCMHWDYEPVTLDEILVYDDIIKKAEAELKSKVMAEAIENGSRSFRQHQPRPKSHPRTWDEYKEKISRIDPEFRKMLDEISVITSPNPKYEETDPQKRDFQKRLFALGDYACVPLLYYLGLTRGQVMMHQRMRQQLSPAEVAERAGITLEEYVAFEMDEAVISEANANTVIAIARILNTDAEELITDYCV